MKRTIFAIIFRIFGAATQFIFTLSIVRLLSVEESGLFFFLYAIALILSAVSRFGCELSGMRKIAESISVKSKLNVDIVIATRIIFTIISPLFLCLITTICIQPIISSNFDATNAKHPTYFMLTSAVMLCVTGASSEILKGAGKPNLGIFYNNLSVPAITSITVILFKCLNLEINISVLTLTFLVAASSVSVLSIASLLSWRYSWVGTFCSQKRYDQKRLCNEFSMEIRRIFRDAPSLTIVTSTSIIMQWIGSFVLGVFGTPASVTGYSLVSRLSIIVSTVNSAITSQFAPTIGAKYYLKDYTSVKCVSQFMGTVIAVTSLPLILLLFLFPQFFLGIFGADQVEFTTTMRILLLGQICSALIGHSGMILTMTGNYSDASKSSIIAIMVLAATMLMLVPLLNSSGAATAMSIAVISGHSYAYYCVAHRLRFSSFPFRCIELICGMKGSWRSSTANE